MKKILVFLLFVAEFIYSQNYIERNGEIFLKDKIVFKLKNSIVENGLKKSIDEVRVINKLTSLGFSNIKNAVNPKDKSSGLINIRTAEFVSGEDINTIIQRLKKIKEIQWAEPFYLSRVDLIPNDPSYINQYSLSKVNAAAAWDISSGSPEVIIGIVDTGVDWDHPDLAANIWTNQTEANGITGIDDDNNGFIDDIRGWDFGGLSGTPDNNPMEDRSDHGTHVAGISGAVTNNNIGVASLGFNCKIMPVKVSQDNIRDENSHALISYGYDGIIYAVDNGAKVINCSWGSYSYSNLAQEVIDYAVSKGVLVIAASGNEGRNEIIYPGKYNGAFSVGYSNSSDKKDGSSNYGYDIDVFAPGASIYSTWMDNGYAYLNGSSMASPLVAALAGLLFAKYPNLTPLQVAEIIRVNCDDIYSLNPTFPYQLGAGRVNAYKALSNAMNSVSVRFNNATFTEIGDGDGVFESGESILINLDLTNFLSPTTNLALSIFSNSNYAEIPIYTKNISSKNTLENFTESFEVQLKNNVPYNHEINFRLEFTDGNYHGFQWTKSIIINPLYATHNAGKISLTFSSKGNLGFNDYPDNQQGIGFSYNNSGNLLFEGGLMYGNSSTKVLSSVRSADYNFQSNSFTMQNPFVINSPGEKADEQGFGIFNDANSPNSLGIQTEINTYQFAEAPNDEFVIVDYRFTNTSQTAINNFYAGLYFDWDIDESDYNDNVTVFNSQGNYAYVYNSNGKPIKTKIGLAVLSSNNTNFYGIHNNGDDSGIGVYDGFSDLEKWTSMTSGLTKTNAGPYDISCVIADGPYNINPGQTIDVAFAICASDSLPLLSEVVNQSRLKYNEIITALENNIQLPNKFLLSQNYPNPFNPTTTIGFSIPAQSVIARSPFIDATTKQSQHVTLKVYDILGREVATLVNEQKPAGNYEVTFDASELSSGVYFYKLQAGSFVQTKKMILLR